MTKSPFYKRIAFISLVLILTSTISAFAQPGDPGGGPGGGNPPVGAGVPLDGGALGLLVAGAIYGMKSLHMKLNEK